MNLILQTRKLGHLGNLAEVRWLLGAGIGASVFDSKAQLVLELMQKPGNHDHETRKQKAV